MKRGRRLLALWVGVRSSRGAWAMIVRGDIAQARSVGLLLLAGLLASCGNTSADAQPVTTDAGVALSDAYTLPFEAQDESETSAEGGARYRTRLALGSEFGCAIRTGGELVCWGKPQIDDGQTRAPAGSFGAIAARLATACAIAADANPVCWGNLDNGLLVPPTTPLLELDVGMGCGCGVSPSGPAICWGSPDLTPPTAPFTQVAASRGLACGVRADASLVCWKTLYPDWTIPAGRFTQIVLGEQHGCAVREDGTLACWGSGAPPTSIDPANHAWGQATPPSGTFTRLAAGDYHTCGIRDDATVSCWGAGTTIGDCAADISQCGQSLPPSGEFIDVAAGFTHTCGILRAGPIVCWGSTTGGRSSPPTDFQ